MQLTGSRNSNLVTGNLLSSYDEDQKATLGQVENFRVNSYLSSVFCKNSEDKIPEAF